VNFSIGILVNRDVKTCVMDLNKAGLAIGVLALVLAIPLAVVANLLTPKVRDWYVGMSTNRLRKRLANITKRLEEAEHEWIFTQAEWSIYQLVVLACMVVGLGFHCLWSVAILLALSFRNLAGHHSVLSLVFLCYVGNFLIFIAVMGVADRTKTRHSTVGRQKLRNEIAKLTSVLKEKGERVH
jgi:hypothetical protein